MHPHKKKMGSGQENLEARLLKPQNQSVFPENGCSTNYSLNVKNMERCHFAETMCPHKHEGVHPPLMGEVFFH
jgi:hypothetical protein